MVLLSCSAGVPQGSIFRPFCSVFVNDIPNHMLMIQYYMNRGKNQAVEATATLSAVLALLSHWLNDSCCTSNLKTVCMFFSHQFGEWSVAVNGGSLDEVEDSKNIIKVVLISSQLSYFPWCLAHSTTTEWIHPGTKQWRTKNKRLKQR